MKMQIASKNINDTSIWLSVDPMASKYPSLSPYVYCANNPIKLVDPDGMELDEWEINKKGEIKRVAEREYFDCFTKKSYNYTPWKFNNFIRNVGKSSDLYRNLGF